MDVTLYLEWWLLVLDGLEEELTPFKIFARKLSSRIVNGIDISTAAGKGV
jgi:hypothetical protein